MIKHTIRENVMKCQKEYFKQMQEQMQGHGFCMNVNTVPQTPGEKHYYKGMIQNNPHNQQTSMFDGNRSPGKNVVCFICGLPGHLAKNCPNKANVICTMCGRRGHTEFVCWDNPKNVNRRPANYVPRNHLKPQNQQNQQNFQMTQKMEYKHNKNNSTNDNLVTTCIEEVNVESEFSVSSESYLSYDTDTSEESNQINLNVMDGGIKFDKESLKNFKESGLFDAHSWYESSDDESNGKQTIKN